MKLHGVKIDGVIYLVTPSDIAANGNDKEKAAKALKDSLEKKKKQTVKKSESKTQPTAQEG